MAQELLENDYLGDVIPSGELEGRARERLYRFREALSVAGQNGFHVLGGDILEPVEVSAKPLNISVHKSLREELMHRGNGLYLSEEYGWLSDSEESSDSFSVLRTAKAETSANGVFFGVIVDSKTDRGLPVAVKPCEKKPEKAYLDWANNSMIGCRGLKNFDPVGFIINGQNTFSITELEPGIETLDNWNWQEVLKDKNDPAYEEQRDLLGQIGVMLAELHKDNIMHGDTQFKNIAIDIAGDAFFIDWEGATLMREDSPRQDKIEKMHRDLKVMIRSVACGENEMGIGLLSDFSPSLQWEYFRDYIFDPYMGTMLDDDDSEPALEALGEIETRLKEYLYSPEGLAKTIQSIKSGQYTLDS